jgi:hypothetical protein
MTDRELLQQALDALQGLADYRYTKPVETTMKALNKRLERCDRCGKKLGGEGDIHTCTPDSIGDAQDKLIAELAAQPEQKWQYGTPLLNLFTKQSEQEPVSMQMPKAGDKVICLEDESLATVVSLTAGGSPDIVFSDGSRGTYLLHEFAKLFGYATPPAAHLAPVPKGWKMVPVEPTREMWTAVNKLDDQCAAGNYDGKGCSIEQAWNCLLDAAPNPPAAQRTWVGLTDEEISHIWRNSPPASHDFARAIEQRLKEKNT